MATGNLSPQEAHRWVRIGVLSALAMLLGYAETFIPIPIPGVKLGLANIAVLVALDGHDISGAFAISAIKVLSTSLIFGSPLTMAYAAAGSLLAFAGMAPLSMLRSMQLPMLSIVGALLHEIGQLVVASTLLGTSVVWYLAPVLLVAGCITGAISGFLAKGLADALPDEPRDESEYAHLQALSEVTQSANANKTRLNAFPPLALVAYAIAILHVQNLAILGILCATGLLSCALTRVCPLDLVRSLRPMLLFAAFTCVMQLIGSPDTAAEESCRALLRLFGVASACTAFMRFVPTRDLTALVGKLVSPLDRLGLRTEGFMLAFDVAVGLLPTLSSTLKLGTITLQSIPRLIPEIYARLEQQALRRDDA